MQESIFVKETMEHARVNLLLLDNLRLFEVLHRRYQLFNA